MLIILLLFALFRTLQGVPLSSPADAPDCFADLNLRETQSHFGQRTLNDIIISCFATIFACTWSAIHPNIPAPTDCWWTRFKRQVVTMGCALVAPEVITVWALRQRLAAKSIMDEYNKENYQDSHDKCSILDGIRNFPNTVKELFHDSPVPDPAPKGPRWTLAHGFFLQMGGFMLSEHGRPIHTLLDVADVQDLPLNLKLIDNIKNGIIDWPRITEADIQDRSKGDAVSKLFIILQTTWFIAQCIARWTQHLPVTELEIVTLGFAMLNGITYALWWNKPQNVGRPVFLERKTQRTISENTVEYSNDSAPTIPKGSDKAPISDTLDKESESILSHSIPRKKSWFRKSLEELMEEAPNWGILISLPWVALMAFFRPIGKLTTVTEIRRDHRVQMFYAAYTNRGDIGAQFLVTVPIIGAIFGSIHLIPSWFIDFPSRQEMWLWRISSLIITAEPVLIPIFAILFVIFDDHAILNPIFISLVPIVFIVYPFARIILLTLSLTSLRSLPSAALQTIEWTTFIPHL